MGQRTTTAHPNSGRSTPIETHPLPHPVVDGATALKAKLVALRRHLCAHPELPGDEQRTAAFVAESLRSLGLEPEEGIGGHGLVSVLTGSHPGPTIAYRADMDALPIQDALDSPYASLELGVKHACGHDVHMAVALGIAELLDQLREQLHGRVLFVFQPAEESLDGARAMIDDGILCRYQPKAMLALHVFPIPVGMMGVAEGPCLAGMEEFRVRFYTPAGNLDGIVEEAITALQALSTSSSPSDFEQFQTLIRQMEAGSGLERTVFLSCWPHSSGSLPPYHLLGLVSMADFSLRPNVQRQIRRTLDQVAAIHGASYDLAITFTNPPLRNHGPLVAEVTPVLEQILGPESVLSFRDPYPFSHEDLALFAAEIPTALLWLGTANVERGITNLLHTPGFDVDEDALVIGVEVMAAAILHLLRAPDA